MIYEEEEEEVEDYHNSFFDETNGKARFSYDSPEKYPQNLNDRTEEDYLPSQDLSDAFARYIEEIKGIPTLSREEVYALGEKIKEGRQRILLGLCSLPNVLEEGIGGWYRDASATPFNAKRILEIPSSITDEAKELVAQKKALGEKGVKKRDCENKLLREKTASITSKIISFSVLHKTQYENRFCGNVLPPESEELYRTERAELVDLISSIRPKDRGLIELAQTQMTQHLNMPKADEITLNLETGLALIKEAKGLLYRHNLKLVVACAKNISLFGLQMMDLVQEGNAGLFSAIDKFDHTRGFKFSTYATWWIRQSIIRSRTKQSQKISIPPDIAMVIRAVRKAHAETAERHGRQATPEELVTLTGCKQEQIWLALSAEQLQNIQELDGAIDHSNDGSPLIDFLESPCPGPLEQVEESQTRLKVLEAFARLSPKEEVVMRSRMRGETLEKIGGLFNQSRENIRLIEEKAFRKLRKNPVLRELWSEGEQIAKPMRKENPVQNSNGKRPQLVEKPEKPTSAFPRSQGKRGATIMTGRSRFGDALGRSLSRNNPS